MVLLQLLNSSSSSSSFIIIHKLHLLLPPSSPHHFPYKPNFKNLSIKCQEPSSTSNSSEPRESTVSSPNKTSSSASGIGFGSNSTNAITPQVVSKKKLKGKKDKVSIIRRSPFEKPSFVSLKEDVQVKERNKNERGFVVGWIIFGAVIILEGIVLSSSGFLPEEWDKFVMKYLYPTFTPTVFLFVAGTAAYGVLKYLKNEKLKD